MKRRITFAGLALALFALSTAVVGCDNWERQTYKALSASKSALDGAQAAYEVSKGTPDGSCPAQTPAIACIPHTQAAFKTITDAKSAQKLAVDAMITYEEMKAATGIQPDALSKAQADVAIALGQLSTIINDVKTLYALGGGK